MDAFDRRIDPSGPAWLVARGLESRGVLAAFTERTGGASPPPFDSLNLGFRQGDDTDAVVANRDAVCTALGVPAFATVEQVHGTRLTRLAPQDRGAGYASPASALAGCDAVEVKARGVPVAILTADCVPVALADASRLVAVHAGWRGLADGIIRAAVDRFPDAGDVVAAIGPAIGPCHYAVREDVLHAIDWGRARTDRRRGRWYLDLPGFVSDELRDAGVGEVLDGAPCTACETERFFSFRRDGRTGRQALVAMRR